MDGVENQGAGVAAVEAQEAATGTETAGAGAATSQETAGTQTADPEAENAASAAGTAEKIGAADAEDKEAEEEKKADPESEKADPEPDKSDEQKALEDREKELQKREQEIQKKELQQAASAYMKEKELPERLLPYVLQEDKEATLSCIDAMKEEFDAALEEKLNQKLAGKTPAGNSGTVTNGDKTDADVFAAALRG